MLGGVLQQRHPRRHRSGVGRPGIWSAASRRRGDITVVFIGDGTLGEGAVYESLNIASKWSLPLLVVLENNLYAQSTSQQETLAGQILARPQAFGIDVRPHIDLGP